MVRDRLDYCGNSSLDLTILKSCFPPCECSQRGAMASDGLCRSASPTTVQSNRQATVMSSRLWERTLQELVSMVKLHPSAANLECWMYEIAFYGGSCNQLLNPTSTSVFPTLTQIGFWEFEMGVSSQP